MGLEIVYEEGQTPLDEDEKRGLKIKTISTKEELDEFEQLLDDTKYWIEEKIYSSDEIAIRFKHRLVSIHCFPNGNGRHSRMMADIIIESIFDKKIYTWQMSNMVKADETRKQYINTLKEADKGNINPLIEFAKN